LLDDGFDIQCPSYCISDRLFLTSKIIVMYNNVCVFTVHEAVGREGAQVLAVMVHLIVLLYDDGSFVLIAWHFADVVVFIKVYLPNFRSLLV